MKKVKLTIREVEESLNREAVPPEWVKRLETDPRKGVQALLDRWKKQQERKLALMTQWEEMSRFERSYWEEGITPIAGVDEVGRGPLAGPVVAAAVILPQECYIPGLNDSKKLRGNDRDRLYKDIDRLAVCWETAVVPVTRIDEINIYQASVEAMTTAVKKLSHEPRVLLTDAVLLPTIEVTQRKIIGGDSRSVSIAAASIMAKVTRDRLMVELGTRYPQYGFERNMGYGTAEHMRALHERGPCKEHRRTFAPVKEASMRIGHT